ncbi:sigma-54-dependent Fis family transcriptional regulator [Pseudonocardia sp. GCM10023141]|uniref:sigma-54-dependent Fis family transcriptional regulator n=1 Tax=Pseudonocardia sp. GCM10023141 TaxID=3252653 RepID=UPI003612456B
MTAPEQVEPPALGEPVLRPVIAASWRRSSACGLDHEKRVELPFDQDLDDDSRLLRAARPVLDRLVNTLSDTPNTVLLADHTARIVQRRVGRKSLYNTLDRAGVAPGFGFHEEFAGTNGVGTALEESKPVVVHGEEHFAGFLRSLSCVGVPIHAPITHAVEGVLDLTCLSSDYNPLMRPLLVEAVEHIQTRLTQMASPSEVALLEEFVRTCRIHRGAVVALRPNVILTNPTAVEHLHPAEHAALWDTARSMAAAGRSDGFIELAGGRYRIRCSPVDAGSRQPGGVVLRLDPHERSVPRRNRDTYTAAPVRPLPGRSPQWQRILTLLADLATSKGPVAITGEAGTGKARLARHLACSANDGRGLRVFNAETERDSLSARVSAALASGDAVVLRRIDRLGSEDLARLESLVELGPGPVGRLFVTARTTAEIPPSLERALARFTHHVWVPPLHQRTEDITDLLPALLAELTGRDDISCSLPTTQALMRCRWHGNVTELRDVLASALAAGVTREVELRHLPTRILQRANQRQLTPLEHAERNLIIETMASVTGNRTEVARILGIGRATLYRRMRSLGIATEQELAR